MVGGKAKAKRGNGTPHPRGRRRPVRTFQEGHNLSNEILQDNVPDQAKHVPTKSSLDNLLSVHAQVAQTLHQVILRPQHEA
jgi:hypothetical protein